MLGSIFWLAEFLRILCTRCCPHILGVDLPCGIPTSSRSRLIHTTSLMQWNSACISACVLLVATAFIIFDDDMTSAPDGVMHHPALLLPVSSVLKFASTCACSWTPCPSDVYVNFLPFEAIAYITTLFKRLQWSLEGLLITWVSCVVGYNKSGLV